MEITIHHNTDVGVARRAVKDLAKDIGFIKKGIVELELVVTELAKNLVIHDTTDGQIIVNEIADRFGKGIEIVAKDRGPGIPDVKRAIKDQYSTANSMGCGLGSVQRHVDEFDIYSHSPPKHSQSYPNRHRPVGTIVMARKWIEKKTDLAPFQYGGYSRPIVSETANGDAFHISEAGDNLYIAVVDGLGHGPNAEVASLKAIRFIKKNYQMAMEHLFNELHEILKKTRGVALTLIHLRLKDRKILQAGVGNVQTRIYPRGERNLISRGGVLGGITLPPLKINKNSWPKNGIMVAFTDGISGRWDLEEMPDMLKHHPTTIAHLILQEHGRESDDATMVVVKEVTT